MSSTTHGTEDRSYLQRLQNLKYAYPALASLDKIENTTDEDRKLVQKLHLERYGRLPGRCALLTFNERAVEHREFLTPNELDDHLQNAPSDGPDEHHRLWILEDLEPAWVNVVGARLGVDPLVFAEQMRTWNFTDSKTIPACKLPSMIDPAKSFTLKYYEIRSLSDGESIDWLRNQMTFAVNTRRYERWRDVDTKSFTNNWRQAFVRRCVSFWTNERASTKGWDAVMLVDPAFDSFEWRDSNPAEANHLSKTASAPKSQLRHTILHDPETYKTQAALWNAREWAQRKFLRPGKDTSAPYHGGSTTLSDISFATAEDKARIHAIETRPDRKLSSPLDEMVLYWTELADESLVLSAQEHSVNAAHCLLKYLATSWMMQLDLIEFGVAQSEYFADDHQVSMDFESSGQVWRAELIDITNTIKDMNYMKRQLIHFERALTLNLVRLGLVLGVQNVSPYAPRAIQDAQKDFLVVHARLGPFRERVAKLSGVANELANLHTAFKNIKDSELGLRLSILGTIVFPMTLVASILSMGKDSLATSSQFWVYWAASVPLVLISACALAFGWQPAVWLSRKWAKDKAEFGQKRQADRKRGSGGMA